MEYVCLFEWVPVGLSVVKTECPRVPAKAGKYIEVANKDKHRLQPYYWNGDVQSQPTDQRNLVTAPSFVLKAYPGYKNSGTSSGACIKLGPKNPELYFSGSTVQYPL